jgi:hypothetical protein
MRNIIILLGTLLVYLEYFTLWQIYDSGYILLEMLSVTWFLVMWFGYYLFKNRIYYWPAIPTAVYLLVIYKSAGIVATNLALRGIPTEYSDDNIYIESANFIVDGFKNADLTGVILYSGINHPGYVWLLGLLYFGLDIYQDTTQVLAAVIINELALVFTVLSLLKYAVDLVQSRWKMLFWISLAFATQDNLLTLAAVVRKDILIMAFIAGIYMAYNLYRLSDTKRNLFLVVTLLMTLALFRLQMGVAMLMLIMADITFNRATVKRRAIMSHLTLAIIASVALFFGYFANVNYADGASQLLTINQDNFAFYSQIGMTRFIYDLPMLGPALWYFLGPLISVFMFSPSDFSAAFSAYPLGMGVVIYIVSKLFILAIYYALFKSFLVKGRNIRECKQLTLLMIIFSVLLQLGGQGSESRHFSMTYPFMLLLALLYYPLFGYHRGYNGEKVAEFSGSKPP